jgi:nitroreductase
MPIFDPKEISQLIRHRRSIYPKQYSGDVIDKKIIEEILENANWAPNHKISEPWRFTVFAGAGLKKLGEFMADQYRNESMKNGAFDETKFEKTKRKPLLASHVISIGMKRDEKERLPEIEEVEAVACAVQNMMLTATAHSLGCYWSSGGVTYYEGTKSFFGLETKDKLLGFIFLGYPKSAWPEGKRRSIQDKVIWVEE